MRAKAAETRNENVKFVWCWADDDEALPSHGFKCTSNVCVYELVDPFRFSIGQVSEKTILWNEKEISRIQADENETLQRYLRKEAYDNWRVTFSCASALASMHKQFISRLLFVNSFILILIL